MCKGVAVKKRGKARQQQSDLCNLIIGWRESMVTVLHARHYVNFYLLKFNIMLSALSSIILLPTLKFSPAFISAIPSIKLYKVVKEIIVFWCYITSMILFPSYNTLLESLLTHSWTTHAFVFYFKMILLDRKILFWLLPLYQNTTICVASQVYTYFLQVKLKPSQIRHLEKTFIFKSQMMIMTMRPWL